MTKRSKKSFLNLKQRTKKNYNERNNFGNQKQYFNLPDDMEFFSTKKGVYTIDIIPYLVKTNKHPDLRIGDADYGLSIFVHRNIGVNKDSYVCLAKTYGNPCPICEEYERLRNEDADEEELRAIKAKQRVLYNVLSHSDGKLKIFEQSHFLFEKELLEDAIDDASDELITFADPDDGKSISFRDTGVQGIGRYKKFKFIDRNESIDDEILDQAVSLDELIIVYSYDELKQFLFRNEISINDQENDDIDIDIDDDDDDEEEEVEEDSNIDDEDEEEEEEDKKLTRKRKTQRKSKKNECPNDLKFGVDYDSSKKCDKCDQDIWEKCATVNAELEEEEEDK